jgi:plastocyanin
MAGPVRRFLARGLVAASVGAAVLSLAFAPLALAADHAVDIAGFAFSPQTITIAAGDTVTWTNSDAQGHTATADGGSFDTGTIANNTSKSVTFDTAGTFGYHCKIHPAMTATIVVEDAATAPPTDTDLAPATGPGEASPLSWLALALAAVAGLGIALRRFAVARDCDR